MSSLNNGRAWSKIDSTSFSVEKRGLEDFLKNRVERGLIKWCIYALNLRYDTWGRSRK